jgi:hypothetical protein
LIPVSLADEKKWSPLFDATVRRRGAVAIDRLLGKAVTAPGRKPKETFQSPEEIPPDRFPAYWTEVRPADGGSTLDDMMDAYGQYCAYLAMRIERATGSPTVGLAHNYVTGLPQAGRSEL